ncbi:MAG TPA: hypothetical protein VM822_14780 [Pseudolabrys sp.]|nr:hypothetical protein [Pseudolabrys sp.]
MATRAGATIAEASGSHAIYVSKPEVVAALVAQAVKSMASKLQRNQQPSVRMRRRRRP